MRRRLMMKAGEWWEDAKYDGCNFLGEFAEGFDESTRFRNGEGYYSESTKIAVPTDSKGRFHQTIKAPYKPQEAFSSGNADSVNSIKALYRYPSMKNDSYNAYFPAMFYGCKQLEYIRLDISMPASCEPNFSSFATGCTKLREVHFEGKAYSSLGTAQLSYAFLRCPLLKEIRLPMAAGGGCSLFSAFEGCTSLESVDLGQLQPANSNSVTWMFFGCTKLRHIKGTARLIDYIQQNFNNTGLLKEQYDLINWERI